MGDSKLGHVPGPEWFEMVCQANLAPSVHLGGLSVQLWNGDLGCSGRVCHGDLQEKGVW